MWAGRAAEIPSPAEADAVLRASLPENFIPQMKEILGQAMDNAPRVIASGLELERIDAEVEAARSSLLPHASVGASPAVVHEKYRYENSPATQHDKFSLYYNGTISQPIFHWGALRNGFEAAQLQKAVASRNVAETRRLLALEVRRSYFNLIGATNGKAAETKALHDLEAESAFAEQQAADGFATKSTAEYAARRVVDYKRQLKRSDDSYGVQWKAFRQVVGVDSLQPSPAMPKEVPAVPAEIEKVLEVLAVRFGAAKPTSLANAEDQIRSEQLTYNTAKVRQRPNLDLALTASQENQQAGGDTSKPPVLTQYYGAYLNINWNLFDGFATQAAKKGSLVRLRQLRTARDQLERDLNDALHDQVENLKYDWVSLQQVEANLQEQQRSTALVKQDYEAGVVPKRTMESALASEENALQAAFNARADFYLKIANYLSFRGEDPAVSYSAKR